MCEITLELDGTTVAVPALSASTFIRDGWHIVRYDRPSVTPWYRP